MAFNDKLREVFSLIDKDEAKTIRIEELPKALRAVGLNPTESQIEDYSRQANLINGKFLDFPEFQKIASSCKSSGNISKEEVLSYFMGYDRDKSGMLGFEDLRSALCDSGDKLSNKEIEVLIKDFDKTGTGKVRIRDLVDGLLNGCVYE